MGDEVNSTILGEDLVKTLDAPEPGAPAVEEPLEEAEEEAVKEDASGEEVTEDPAAEEEEITDDEITSLETDIKRQVARARKAEQSDREYKRISNDLASMNKNLIDKVAALEARIEENEESFAPDADQDPEGSAEFYKKKAARLKEERDGLKQPQEASRADVISGQIDDLLTITDISYKDYLELESMVIEEAKSDPSLANRLSDPRGNAPAIVYKVGLEMLEDIPDEEDPFEEENGDVPHSESGGYRPSVNKKGSLTKAEKNIAEKMFMNLSPKDAWAAYAEGK